MKLYLYPPVAVSVSVPPIAYTDPTLGNTPVTPLKPLPVAQNLYVVAKAFLKFSDDNVTDTTWTELIADVGVNFIRKMHLFMTSGQPMILGIGAAASEDEYCYIMPGGSGFVEVAIEPGQRLSLQAVSTNGSPVTVNTGIILVNFYA